MLIGQVLWATIYCFLEFSDPSLARLADKFAPLAFLVNVLTIMAAPVAIGGWLLIWGDNGPPYPWMDSTVGHIAVGFGLYGIVGAVVAQVCSGFPRCLSYHFSLRTMLIVTTLVAVVLGLGVWLVG